MANFRIARCPRCTKPYIKLVRNEESDVECGWHDALYVYCKYCTWKGPTNKLTFQKRATKGQWLKVQEEIKKFNEKLKNDHNKTKSSSKRI